MELGVSACLDHDAAAAGVGERRMTDIGAVGRPQYGNRQRLRHDRVSETRSTDRFETKIVLTQAANWFDSRSLGTGYERASFVRAVPTPKSHLIRAFSAFLLRSHAAISETSRALVAMRRSRH